MFDLDFSEFHPLDHSLWECRGYAGGRRRHLRYRWDYQWSEELSIRWAHMIGRHVWTAYAYRRPYMPQDVIDGKPAEYLYAAGCRGCLARPDGETAERLIADMKAHALP